MKKFKVVFTTIAVLGMIALGLTNASAYTIPGDANMANLYTYLTTAKYFNSTPSAVYALDFTGTWQYTAIASEAGNWNITESPDGSTLTFSNANTSNWGTWKTINFANGNIYFTDKIDGPADVALDPFGTNNSFSFQVYQLTADSKALTYLGGSPVLKAGTYIVGFNDNLCNQSNDRDYDDIIIAMQAKPVPEPSTMLLLGLGLAGAAVARRKFKK